MRLTELTPMWFPLGAASRTRGGLMFKCPHCREMWILCKSIPATLEEQIIVMASRGIRIHQFVPVPRAAVWQIVGDFADLTVSPHVDATAAGHRCWRIERGEVTGQ